MKKLILLLLFCVYSFAITPFSLENVKELNVKLLNKNETISKALEEKIENKVKEKLEAIGIKTNTDKYSHFKMSVKIDKFDDVTFVRTSILIQEDVTTMFREKPVHAMAITYQKSDEFEAEKLEEDIYESFVNYLLVDFIDQYKEEN